MKMSLPASAEIVVVGAGVIGLAIAFDLARRGKSVLVLERDRIGAGATRASAGMLAPVSEAEAEEPALVELALESHRRYPEFVEAVESASGMRCGFRQEGTLVVALGHDHEEELDHLLEAQRQRGLVCQRLTAEETFQREPHLSGWVTGGLLAEEDFQVDPRALALALAAATRAHGGHIVEGSAVEALDRQKGRLVRVTGRTEGQEFSVDCDAAVVAAGAWSSTDIRSQASELGIRPVKGQTVRVRGPELMRHVLRTPEVYVVPREGGELVIGATVEEQGFDVTPTAGAVMDLLRRAWHVLPGIYDCVFSEVSVGLRPAARNHLPLIGATDEEGVFVATGHYRHGVLLAPVTAWLLADLIAGGTRSDLLEHFSPGRLRVRL
jgi:glycine oxidase